MVEPRRPLYSGPIFIAPAIFVFCLALIEKGLNLMGSSIPLIDVFPRQLLEWALILLVFEIAFTLRQTLELVRHYTRG
ncbi:MAG: hypothetical protein ACR2QM_05960 [Longimicrobiales bacterium]